MQESATTVSQAVWLLGQLRGYETKKDLADAMGWEHSRLSRTLRGQRQWTINDLDTAARTLGLAGPGELFRPLSELVNEVAKSGTTMHKTMVPYFAPEPACLTSRRQVKATVGRMAQRSPKITRKGACTRVVLRHAA